MGNLPSPGADGAILQSTWMASSWYLVDIMGGQKNIRMTCGFLIQRFGRGRKGDLLGLDLIQGDARLLPGLETGSFSLAAPPPTMDPLSTSHLSSLPSYLTRRMIKLASLWITMTCTCWTWPPPWRPWQWWWWIEMGLAQRVYPAPCSRRSFTCQPATPSVNLCALWKAYQLVRKGAASASYKTSLRRRVLTPSLQKSSLVKAQIVFYSFAVTRSSKKGEEPNEVVLPCFEFLWEYCSSFCFIFFIGLVRRREIHLRKFIHL